MWLLMSQPYHLFCLCHHRCNLHYLCHLHSTSCVFPVFRIPFRSCRVDHSCCYLTVCFLPQGLYFNFKLKRRNLSFAFLNTIFSFASFVLKLQSCKARNTLQDGGLGRCYYFLGTSGNLLHRVLPST